MGRSTRNRSVSGGSYKDMKENSGVPSSTMLLPSSNSNLGETSESTPISDAALRIFQAITKWRDAKGKPVLFTDHDHHWQCDYGEAKEKTTTRHSLAIAASLLDRSLQVDSSRRQQQQHHRGVVNGNANGNGRKSLLRRGLLLSSDSESGYTALHWAIFQREVAPILLLLRHALQHDCYEAGSATTALTVLSPLNGTVMATRKQQAHQRLTQRPMSLLLMGPSSVTTPSSSAASTVAPSSSSSPFAPSCSLATTMAATTDKEGMTPSDLLGALQRDELLACRLGLPRPRISLYKRNYQAAAAAAANSSNGNNADRASSSTSNVNNDGVVRRSRRRPRGNSFELNQHDGNGVEDEQNEFDVLSRHLELLPRRDANQQEEDASNHDDASDSEEVRDTPAVEYGCEVLTFGSAHHCALGIVAGQDSGGGVGGGSGRGGACDKKNELRPYRVQAFAQDAVGRVGGAVAIACATHHTLVANAAGEVFAFGLGKGGRLGTGTEALCAMPTRITGPLKNRRVVAVAAAENHSLCVTECGLTFSWGSNRFGQLGTTGGDDGNGGGNGSNTTRCLPRRIDDLKQVFCVSVAAGEKHSVVLSKHGEVYVFGDNTSGQLGASRRSGIHKVQRVESLWNAIPPKAAIAIAAAEQSTMVLTVPTGTGLPVNTIYSWGHGSHVPSKVHFEAHSGGRYVNPVAIACARYNNVAVSSDGLVYSWGLHAETLGTGGKPKKSPTVSSVASPQLVTGMLPENGGGIAVAVSASENRTAVITDTGALYTWGATDGKNILGHEGVRWQPNPKRVPGVHRAVAVAAAKEHTVLLMGASFPSPPDKPTEKHPQSLEMMAAQAIAQHVDLFNVLPVLITAERAQCTFLIDHCTEFIRRNLDGVLNVGKKSDMDCYLNEQLLGCQELLANEERDGRYPPVVMKFITAGNAGRASFERGVLSNVNQWMVACQDLLQTSAAGAFIDMHAADKSARVADDNRATSRRSRSSSRSDLWKNAPGCSERCLDLTRDMDLSSRELVVAKHAALTKEVRGIRKRLSQISKLVEVDDNSVQLTPEQECKVARRPQLEADLQLFEPALEAVEKRLKEILSAEGSSGGADAVHCVAPAHATPEEKVTDKESEPSASCVRCEVCQISCPDQKSYELHLNGRKHRNRVAQAAEQEAKTAAASLLEESRRQQMLESKSQQPEAPPKPLNPWIKSQVTVSQVTVSYKLPPPPHPVPDSMAEPQMSCEATSQKFSLRDIMEDEKRKSKTKPAAKKVSSKLQLPPGSAPAIKSPPWSKAPVRVQVTEAGSQPSFPPSSPSKASCSISDFIELPARKNSGRSMAKAVSVSAPPSSKKPAAWSSSPARVSGTPSQALPPPSASCDSLGDIMVACATVALEPHPAAPTATTTPSSANQLSAPWATPRKDDMVPIVSNDVDACVVCDGSSAMATTTMTTATETRSTMTTNFRDILEEEKDFKAKADQTFGTNSRWLIERRERAGSLREIQSDAYKEQEERLFIEEQFRILKQIEDDAAAAAKKKKEEEDEKERKRRKRSNNKNSYNNRNHHHPRYRGKKHQGNGPKQHGNKSKHEECATRKEEASSNEFDVDAGSKPQDDVTKGNHNNNNKKNKGGFCGGGGSGGNGRRRNRGSFGPQGRGTNAEDS